MLGLPAPTPVLTQDWRGVITHTGEGRRAKELSIRFHWRVSSFTRQSLNGAALLLFCLILCILLEYTSDNAQEFHCTRREIFPTRDTPWLNLICTLTNWVIAPWVVQTSYPWVKINKIGNLPQKVVKKKKKQKAHVWCIGFWELPPWGEISPCTKLIMISHMRIYPPMLCDSFNVQEEGFENDIPCALCHLKFLMLNEQFSISKRRNKNLTLHMSVWGVQGAQASLYLLASKLQELNSIPFLLPHNNRHEL